MTIKTTRPTKTKTAKKITTLDSRPMDSSEIKVRFTSLLQPHVYIAHCFSNFITCIWLVLLYVLRTEIYFREKKNFSPYIMFTINKKNINSQSTIINTSYADQTCFSSHKDIPKIIRVPHLGLLLPSLQPSSQTPVKRLQDSFPLQ